MNVLGLILARGGSRRIPRKNLKLLGGVPLLAWTICSAKHCYSLDEVVVSSDDDEILHVARTYGAKAIKRPPELAADDMSSYPPIFHALDQMPRPFEYVCLLQPTSPLRWSADIHVCVEWCVGEKRDGTDGTHAVVSVEYGREVPNGAVYVGRTDWLRDAWWRYSRGLLPDRPFDDPSLLRWEMPPDRSVDIDTPEDFTRAEEYLRGAGHD